MLRGEICEGTLDRSGGGVYVTRDHACSGRRFARLPPLDAADNLRLLEDRRSPKWGKLRAKGHDRNHRGGAGHRRRWLRRAGYSRRLRRPYSSSPSCGRSRSSCSRGCRSLSRWRSRSSSRWRSVSALPRSRPGDLAASDDRWSRELPRYQALYAAMVTWLDGHGISVAGLWAEHFNVGWLLRATQQVTGARQYHAQLLGDRADLRDARTSRSRERQAEDRAAG